MNIENITNDDIRNELKFLENKYKIVKKYVDYLLCDIESASIFQGCYKVITKMVREKSNIDENITHLVNYQDIIKYLMLELNKKYLNYPYLEFMESMLNTALLVDNNIMISIIDEIDSNEIDEYEKISKLYNAINDLDIKVNKK